MATINDVLKRIHALVVLGRPYYNRAEIKTSQTWTVPAGVTKIGAFLVGGGGGGYLTYGSTYRGGGGGGGYIKHVREIPVTPGQKITIAIGAGGTADAETPGGTTSLLTYSAAGGFPGRRGSLNNVPPGGDGGSGGGGWGGGANGSDSVGSDSGGGVGARTPTMDPWSGILYAGGGEGGGRSNDNQTRGPGAGGGGTRGTNGQANTGGGGGGGLLDFNGGAGGAGGSGIAVIYY